MNKIDEEGEYLLRKTLKEFLRLNEYYPPEKGIMLMVSIREQPIADMSTEIIRETVKEYEDLPSMEYTAGWKVKLIEELEKRGA